MGSHKTPAVLWGCSRRNTSGLSFWLIYCLLIPNLQATCLAALVKRSCDPCETARREKERGWWPFLTLKVRNMWSNQKHHETHKFSPPQNCVSTHSSAHMVAFIPRGNQFQQGPFALCPRYLFSSTSVEGEMHLGAYPTVVEPPKMDRLITY